MKKRHLLKTLAITGFAAAGILAGGSSTFASEKSSKGLLDLSAEVMADVNSSEEKSLIDSNIKIDLNLLPDSKNSAAKESADDQTESAADLANEQKRVDSAKTKKHSSLAEDKNADASEMKEKKKSSLVDVKADLDVKALTTKKDAAPPSHTEINENQNEVKEEEKQTSLADVSADLDVKALTVRKGALLSSHIKTNHESETETHETTSPDTAPQENSTDVIKEEESTSDDSNMGTNEETTCPCTEGKEDSVEESSAVDSNEQNHDQAVNSEKDDIASPSAESQEEHAAGMKKEEETSLVDLNTDLNLEVLTAENGHTDLSCTDEKEDLFSFLNDERSLIDLNTNLHLGALLREMEVNHFYCADVMENVSSMNEGKEDDFFLI